MSNLAKIKYYDLIFEAVCGRIGKVMERKSEFTQINQILNRELANNIALVGPKGSGKTNMVFGMAVNLSKASEDSKANLVSLDMHSLTNINQSSLPYYIEAIKQIPRNTIVVLDDFGIAVLGKPTTLDTMARLILSMTERTSVRVLISCDEAEFVWIKNNFAGFEKLFGKVEITETSDSQMAEMAEIMFGRYAGFQFMKGVADRIISYQKKFSALGSTPRVLAEIIDSAVSFTKLCGQKAISVSVIDHVVSKKLDIPANRLTQDDSARIKQIEETIKKSIVGQDYATGKIINIIRRAELGLKNPNRPRASFLVLGPSGVGKTETAKVLAESLFESDKNFIRFDMSEFSESHTGQRLLGAPPGYTGFDAGGELTNRLEKNSNCLILLDEIEKAHPKIFDIFLQLLDEGRITSGQGNIIDAKQSIIYATSNAGTEMITKLFEDESVDLDKFISSDIITELKKYFRAEFLNRFDAILVFKPLGVSELLEIAKLEIEKIEKRMQREVRFGVDVEKLRPEIIKRADLGLGARPVKRLIEETCESLVAEFLMNKH